ncbi:MAG: hypothetical protein ABWZ75_03860 [Novosphingobium sp.]
MIFSLFGLLLGLGIGEILRDVAKAWRIKVGVSAVKQQIRIGWLVPLFAALVIMDQTHFYITAYYLRDAIPLTYLSLLGVLAVIGTYFICSTFVFPDDPEDWSDFDDYYLRVRRFVAGGIVAAKMALVAIAIALVQSGQKFDDMRPESPISTILTLANIAVLIALIFVANKRANLVLLAWLNLSLITQAIADSV